MTYEFVTLTNQVTTAQWGWTIALFLWFIGLAGMSLVLNVWLRSKLVLVISAISAVVGTLFVLSHLHRLLNLPMAAINSLLEWKFNFASWMFIGICILAVLCLVTIFESFRVWKGNNGALECKYSLWFNGVLGLAATAYSGFLLTQAVGIPLWTTASLPILWVFSGLACAIGLVEILASTNRLSYEGLSWLSLTANLVHIGEAIVLFAFLQVAFAGTPGAVAGAQGMLGDTMFWAGAVGFGIVVPVILGNLKGGASLKLVSGVCAIIGALCLRASVLFAGVFDPVIF